MASSRSINVNRDINQSVVVGRNLNGNVAISLKSTDRPTDDEIIRWLFEISHLQVVEHDGTHSGFARKLEIYMNRLKEPEHSGRWLLDDPSFIGWRDGKLQERILWCCGKPGLGNSTLTSLAIRNLQSIPRLEADMSACLYLYFEREHRGQRQLNSDSSQRHVRLIQYLLAQLVSQTASVSQVVREHYAKFQTQGLTIHSTLDLINKEASLFRRVYIVIDALEKYNSADGQDSDENPRYAFLSNILNLGPNFRYLVVSTFQYDIRRLLAEAKKILITKEHVTTDLKRFIQSKLQEKLQLKVNGTVDESSWNACCDAILRRSEGQYSHAKLLIDRLFSKKSALKDFATKLKDLPSTQNEIYKDWILDRTQTDKTQLIHVLQWLTFAMRPLTLEELSCAVYYLPHINQRSESDKTEFTEDDIHRICDDFVIYNGETISIAHSTAVDFLEREYFAKQAESPEMLIAKTCISYLSSPAVKSALKHGLQKPLALCLEDFPLFNYAAEHWCEHFVIANEGGDLNGDVMSMLSDENVVTSIYNTLNPQKQESGVTGLHLAAQLDLGDIVESLIKSSKAQGDLSGGSKKHNIWLNKRTGSGETSLHYAAQQDDNPEIVKKLLRHGINPNFRNNDGQTALHQAIKLSRNAASLELASWTERNGISHSLLIDIPDKQGYTPLMSAVKQGMPEVVMALIDAGADVNWRAQDGCSALQIATANDNRELVKLLLRSNAKARWEEFSTMHWAAVHGCQEIVSQLYMRGEDVNSITSEGSPMACAIRHDHRMLVWHLLSYGAKLNVSDLDGNTALHAAVEENMQSIIWLLLENGADPNIQNNQGETPLHRAVLNDNVQAAWLLLHKGSTPELRDKNGDMPIHIATARDNAPVLSLILHYPHDSRLATEALNESHCMPIHVAAREGAMSTASWLIGAGADVNAVALDGYGYTPLHIAAERGKNAEKFIPFFIATCRGWLKLDLDRKDTLGRTPLHLAVDSGNELVAHELLAGGANASPVNQNGLTPLHEAAIKQRVSVVKLLLQYDAKIMLPDDNEGKDEPDEDYTVMEKAMLLMIDDENDGKTMLATLLRAGVDVNRQSKDDGKTPLHFAALLGLTEAIEIMYAIAVTRPDLTIRDEEGKTAVEVCVEEGHEIDWERIMASRVSHG